MRKILYLSIALIGFAVCTPYAVNAQQGVAINASGSPADNSAGLDVDFPDHGVLLPRMTTVQRDAITSPATGLTIYNTDCNVYNYNAGTPSSPNWTNLSASNALNAGVTIISNPPGLVCGSVTFTATPTSGLVSPSYQWQVNGSPVLGANSTTYTTSSLNNGDIVTCVLTSTQACVTGSPATSNSIVVNKGSVPATPGSISGTSPLICITGTSSGNVYSVSAVAGATNYNWVVPPFASITAGGGTNSITVTFGPSQGTGTINVTASNDCGASSASSLSVTVSQPAPSTPGTITGPSESFYNSSGSVYSIAPVANATTYTWSGPSGSSVASGQGTDTAVFNFGSNPGYVSVTAGNACGTSSANTTYVSLCNQTHGSQSFGYSSSYQTFSVPCTDTVQIQCWGAAGASNWSTGGYGGYIEGTLHTSPSTTLYIFVGGYPPNYGCNGGCNGGGSSSINYYAAGGGETDVRVGGTSTSNWVIVAGGGGGDSENEPGGSGGGAQNSPGGGSTPSFCNNGTGSGWGGWGGPGAEGAGSPGGCYGGSGAGGCCGWSGGGGGGGLNSGGGGGGSNGYCGYVGGTGTMGQGGSGTYNGCYGCNNNAGGGGGYYGGGGSAASDCAAGSGGGGSSWAISSMTNVNNTSYSGNWSNSNGYVTFTW